MYVMWYSASCNMSMYVVHCTSCGIRRHVICRRTSYTDIPVRWSYRIICISYHVIMNTDLFIAVTRDHGNNLCILTGVAQVTLLTGWTYGSIHSVFTTAACISGCPGLPRQSVGTVDASETWISCEKSVGSNNVTGSGKRQV